MLARIRGTDNTQTGLWLRRVPVEVEQAQRGLRGLQQIRLDQS